MSEDWAAVSIAINERLAELNLTQRALVDRSQVSKATVAEIRNNIAERKRSTRTLEALSLALDWHPQHLEAVLNRRRTPDVDEPVVRPNDTAARLAAIELQLEKVLLRLDSLADVNAQLDEIGRKIDVANGGKRDVLGRTSE